MEKIAQKRSLFNEYIREKVNMPGKYLEGFFKPEIERVMKALKDLDDKIRANLTGQKIGEASAPEDKTSVKDIIKSARGHFNRREYIAGFSDLAHFDKKMSEVAADIIAFQKIDLDSIHSKFLFQGLPKDYEEKLKRTREYMDNKKAEDAKAFLVKSAAIGGLIDFLTNIGTKRGRGLMAWEKKYPQKTKELREGGAALVDQAQILLDSTISSLKEMATARATRRPDAYVDAAQSIVEGYNKFDKGPKGFRNYYGKAIKPFLEIKDAIEAKEKADEEKRLADENKKKEDANVFNKAPATQSPSGLELAQAPTAPQTSLPTGGPPFTPAPTVPELGSPQARPAPSTPASEEQFKGELVHPKTGLVLSHANFYKSLEALGSEDPRILASYISKYAKSIQKTDLVTAVKLFNIVKNIRG
jgi:hypothetical protein